MPPTRSRSLLSLKAGIGFLDIASLVGEVLARYDPPAPPSIDDGAGDRPRGPARGRRADRKDPRLSNPGFLFTVLGVPARHRAADLRPRARPLFRRPLVRGEGGHLLDRLRPRDRRLDRQARHALEGRLAAARRLRQVRRRHEPGEHAERRMAVAAAPRSAPDLPGEEGLAALPDRAGRPGRPISCSRSSPS